MTWLDAVCLLTFVVVALGGYAQGFVRGVLRLLTLVAGGALGVLFMLRLTPSDDLRTMVIWTVGAAILGIVVAGLLCWSIARAIPPAIHNAPINRVLGVLPALVIELAVLVAALGFADRVAMTPEQSYFLRSGFITGPLIVITDWIEQFFVTVR